MILYVDLEHERLRQDTALWRLFATRTLEAKYRLEEITGLPCLIVKYDRINPARLRAWHVQALVVGGHYTALPHYAEADLAGLRAVLREAAWPTLAVCGGFQLMAQTYGADIGPMAATPQPLTQAQAAVPGEGAMGRLRGGNAPESLPETPLPPDGPETDLEAAGLQVWQERGFMPVRVLQTQPLFEGLGSQMTVFQLHSWEVKSVPASFRLLAESDLCRVQALAHQSAPLFGTQFHPESYDDAHPDGRRILENFFRLAGIQGGGP
ncbi:MAG: GMP synthase subunit A [Anaerolineae bacterium]